jgi:biopolymer transport protein ExbD/biopolymer transport protein TolR
MRKLSKGAPESEIPTSSMADIAFLLIIFFMVTAVFSATKGLEFKLPKDDDNSPPKEEEAVFVKVGADGSVLVDCKPMTLEEIKPYLEPKLLRNPEKPVILYVDAGAVYQDMIRVYDVLGSAKLEKEGWKVKNISVPTQTEVQEYIQIFGHNPFESQCG